MSITAKDVQALREKTGAGMMDCKKALQESGGNMDEAVKYLREKGIASATKREGRSASEGTIGTYLHHTGKIAVLVELNCETDFVARNEEFQALARELALQVASANPTYLRAEDVPEDVLTREREIAENLARNEGKPEAALPKIVEGRVRKWLEENCLLTQASIRDPKKQVGDLVQDLRAKLGENVQVRRFVRYKVGEEA
ncbi:MAG: translation elongation factor Ts [Armatimonadota bacterium]